MCNIFIMGLLFFDILMFVSDSWSDIYSCCELGQPPSQSTIFEDASVFVSFFVVIILTFPDTSLIGAFNFELINQTFSGSIILNGWAFLQTRKNGTDFFIDWHERFDTFLAKSMTTRMKPHGSYHEFLAQWAIEILGIIFWNEFKVFVFDCIQHSEWGESVHYTLRMLPQLTFGSFDGHEVCVLEEVCMNCWDESLI